MSLSKTSKAWEGFKRSASRIVYWSRTSERDSLGRCSRKALFILRALDYLESWRRRDPFVAPCEWGLEPGALDC